MRIYKMQKPVERLLKSGTKSVIFMAKPDWFNQMIINQKARELRGGMNHERPEAFDLF